MTRAKKIYRTLSILLSFSWLIITPGCRVSETSATGQYFLVMRYNQNGSPDIKFEGDGIAYTFFPYTAKDGKSDLMNVSGQLSAEAKALAFAGEKRIFAAGWALMDGKKQAAIACYLGDDGRPDKEFDGDGKTWMDVSDALMVEAHAIALAPWKRIILAGFVQQDTEPDYCDFFLACFTEAGIPDQKFGRGGKVTTDFPGVRDESASLVAVDPGGKIVVAGTGIDSSGSSALLLARYLSNGIPDQGFGKGGKVVVFPPVEVSFTISDLAMDAAGKIVLTGWISRFGRTRFLLARVGSGGQLDGEFGSGGLVSYDVSETASEKAARVTVDRRGRIIVSGETGEEGGNRRIVVARFSNKGKPDSDFGEGGMVVTDIDETQDEMVQDVTTDAGGKIIIAGRAITQDWKRQILLARYNENGRLDDSFNERGYVLTEIPGAAGHQVNAVRVDPAGKIVLAGWVAFM